MHTWCSRRTLWAWLTLALPFAPSRRALAAPPPVFEGPWNVAFTDPYPGAAPTLVDIDGDGDLDVFVADYFNFEFFRNTGTAQSPAFDGGSRHVFGLEGYDASIALAFVDIDGDGDLDLFSLGAYYDLRFLENTGSGTSPAFAPPVAPFGYGPIQDVRPAFADIDGDGDFDAFLASSPYYGPSHFYFLANTGTSASPSWIASPSIDPFGLPQVFGGNGLAPAFVDIDGDGDLDVIEGFCVDPKIWFLENTGKASSPAFGPSSPKPFGLPVVADCNVPAFGDLDGDGDLDALVGLGNGHVLLFPNSGNASSPAFGAPPNPFGLTGHSMSFADIDADGDLDAFTGGFFFQNLGSPTDPIFAAPQVSFGADHVPVLADIDGDGDLDALAGSGKGLCLYRNDGTASSPDFAPCSIDPFGLTSGYQDPVPAIADIDGDGDLDVFVGTAYRISFFENTGSTTSPAFAAPAYNPFGLVPKQNDHGGAAPSFLDVDGDGDLDAFVGEDDGSIWFFANTGTSSSPSFTAKLVDPFGLDGGQISRRAIPSFADIDGDGDVDAFVGAQFGDVRFFRNVIGDPLFIDGFESGDTSAWSGTS